MENTNFKPCTLDDIAVFKNGKSISPSLYSAFGSNPVMGSNGEIARTDEVLNETPVIVIGRVGAYCGSVFRTHSPSWITDNAIIAEPKSGVDIGFLYYRLKSLNLNRTAIGSAQPLITQSGLKVVKTVTPSTSDEQKAIAQILSALDDKIELNRQMNRTLEAMAQALFKSWFVDFDPVTAKAAGRKPYGMDEKTSALFPDAFEDSVLGAIPKGWGVRSVYDAAVFINGLAFKQSDFSTTNKCSLPIIKIVELKYGIGSQTKFTEQVFESVYKLSNGDILFSWSGSPETSIDTFIWTGGEAWLNQHIFKVVTVKSDQKGFVYSILKFLRSDFIEIARNKQTTGLGHVTVKDLKRMHIPAPSDDVLLCFNNRVNPIFELILSKKIESNILEELRNMLLPKLLSGEIRLRQAENHVAEAV